MLSCVDDRFHGKKTVVRIYLGRKHRSAVVGCPRPRPSSDTESDTGFLMMTKALLTLPTSTRCGCERRFTVGTLRRRFAGWARSAIRAVSRWWSDPRGVATIELSIIAPLLVLALICTADLGLGIYRNMQVQNAAQAGAEYAATHGFAASGIVGAVQAATAFSGITASPEPTQFCGCASATGVASATCGSACSGGSIAGTYVSVSALATYTTLLPYPLLPSSFSLTAQATVRLQ
jgi:Flp pilus assembly protein TadG